LPLFPSGAQRASRSRPSSLPSSSSRRDPTRRLRSLLVRGTVAAGLGLLLTLPAGGAVSAHELTTRETTAHASDFKVGQRITDHGLTLTVPTRGHFVWGEIHFTDGTVEVLSLETARDGHVVTRGLGEDRDPAAAAAAIARAQAEATADRDALIRPGKARNLDDPLAGSPATTRTSECSITGYNLYPWRISTYRWYLQSGSIPWYLRGRTDGTTIVLNQIKRANLNIVTERNICHRADYVSASYSFSGYTSRGNNISSGASCTGGDGFSVINFGYLPSGVYGMTCVYGISGGNAREGDVRMSYGVHWETYSSLCSNETLIEAAMTHELGHVYGLAHAYTSGLTMNPYVADCSLAPATLALGDMLGLEKKY
jgi:hypothetical protein